MMQYPDYERNPPPEDPEEEFNRRTGCATAAILTLIGWGVILAIMYLVINFIFPPLDAKAHDAPSGWSYDPSCCNTMDCRPVDGPDDASRRHHKVIVTEVTGGYRVNKPGLNTKPDFVEWNSPKIRPSKDGEYHWCSTMQGSDTGSTICLYVPDRGY